MTQDNTTQIRIESLIKDSVRYINTIACYNLTDRQTEVMIAGIEANVRDIRSLRLTGQIV